MATIRCMIALLSALLSMFVSNGDKTSVLPEYYAREAIVLEFIDDEVVFEDTTENLWGADKEVFEFEIGAECTLIMDSMGTPSIYDDEVCGVLRGWNSYGLPIAYADYGDFHNLHVS